MTRCQPGAKLLAKARGKPLIEWAIGPAVEAELDELVVVCGAVDLSGVVPDAATLLPQRGLVLGPGHLAEGALDWCARQGHLSAVVGLGRPSRATADSCAHHCGSARRPDRLRDLTMPARAPRAARRRDLVAAP